ncbi:cell division protein FtsQ/DivIB [Deinococcus maricopensis]|uniref:Polypeptide-transport-associated domain protein FtsQ-type n=1 Tax=Deinococcus maricopensis (strain DSM 21211 / LMG 22137 / NRRL B-23946 / LB-34) TaxID=709986 RepID=E8U8A6_DEIML|nr:FtsQ-type POTRA domain-containing protein [Deinococcus maricopensis]ADV67295.1 Polypeptide-transport-associated domain protein FtsQ-type [Deinococcus maricopensis DSM 21211]
MAVNKRARRPKKAPELTEAAPRARRRWPVLRVMLVLALFGGIFAGLWYGLPVRTVVVSGNQVLREARVRELAGLTPQFGWVFYGGWRAQALRRHPWVQGVKITQVFPDRVEVHVQERLPFARWRRPDGRTVVVAADRVVLPGAAPTGPLLTGWGPDRLGDAVRVARTLTPLGVKSVAYTPSGVTVETARGTLWSGNLDSLRKYAMGVTMFPGKRINIYPWGVSVQE